MNLSYDVQSASWQAMKQPASYRHGKILLFLCLLTLITHTVATAVKFYPNQIWYSSVLLVGIIVLFFIIKKKLMWRGVFRSGLIVYVYFIYLGLTALWAEYPEYTFDSLKFDFIYVFIFWLFYCFSLNVKNSMLRIFFAVFPPIVFIFVFLYYIAGGIESSRLGNPLQVVIAIPYIFVGLTMSKRKLLYGLCLVLSLILAAISMQKAAMVTTLFGLTASIFLIYSGSFLQRFLYRILVGFIVILCSVIVLLEMPVFREYTLTHIARFGTDVKYGDMYLTAEAEDMLRSTINSYSMELLKENWVIGIGYMNFMGWTATVYGYWGTTTTGWNIGKEIFGASLHNAFMTWALEGGIPCVLIVGIMLFKYYSLVFKILRNSSNEDERLFIKATAVAMLQLLLYGMFHQVHQTPQFWLMIGIVYAMKTYHSSKGEIFTTT